MEKKVDPTPTKPQTKLVSSAPKVVRTNTGMNDPDRMEVINTVSDRVRSRLSDARDSAMRKVRKGNNTVTEAKKPPKVKKKVGAVRATAGYVVGNLVLHGTGALGKWAKKKIRGEEMERIDELTGKGQINAIASKAEKDRNAAKKVGQTDIAAQKSDRFKRANKLRNKIIDKYGDKYDDRKGAPSKKLTAKQVENNKRTAANKYVRHIKSHNEETMNENLQTMIDAVINRQPGEFSAALSAEMQSRAAAVIQDYKQDLAQRMFATPQEDDPDDLDLDDTEADVEDDDNNNANPEGDEE